MTEIDPTEKLRRAYDPEAARLRLEKAAQKSEGLACVIRRIKGLEYLTEHVDVETVPVTWDELPAFVRARR